jgi:hypothetical protein
LWGKKKRVYVKDVKEVSHPPVEDEHSRNQFLDVGEALVETSGNSINAFSSFFKPNPIHTVCRGKALKVLDVVLGYKEWIVLQINIRVGIFPDKLFDINERYTKLPRSIVKLNSAPRGMLMR